MNTALLKLGRRFSDGSWRWAIPGHGNPITYLPEALTMRGWGPSVRWPHADGVRAVDLDRHRKLAKAEIRKLLLPGDMS